MEHTRFSCYLLNLDKDADRLTFMDKQLKELGIPYERIPGINGKSFSEEQVITYYDKVLASKNGTATLTHGELGCALSHQEAYRKMIANSDRYALILEDDVLLPKNFKTILDDSIERNEKKDEWEDLSFDYYAYGISFLTLWVPSIFALWKKTSGCKDKTISIIHYTAKYLALLIVVLLEELQMFLFRNQPITPIKPTAFAGAYLISLAGAKKMLAVHPKIVYLADQLPNIARRKNGLRFRIYSPLVVTQQKQLFTSNLQEQPYA